MGMRSRHATRALPRAILLAPTDAGLAIARSLSARGVRMSMLGESYRWALRTRWAEGVALGGLPEDRDRWLSELSALGREGDGVLLPCTDAASELVASERALIPANLRSFEAPDGAHLALMDKVRSAELAAGLGIRVPWSLAISSPKDLERAAEEADYPCLLKPVLSHRWRKIFGDYRVIPIRDRGELRARARPALDEGLDVLVTEHIPGPDRNGEIANLLRRADGTYALAFANRKLREYPPGFGAGALTEAIESPETVALATRLLDAAGFVGVCGVELKLHAETGERVFLETNVRVVQGFGLGDLAGADASWRVYATLADLPLGPQPPLRTGVRMVTASLEPRAIATNLRERRLTPRELLAGYRRVRGLGGISIGDPGPIAALARGELRRAARRLARRERGTRTPSGRGPGSSAG
jgi:predicted ATP-grasp superfamily ATP-dependent carboligase